MVLRSLGRQTMPGLKRDFFSTNFPWKKKLINEVIYPIGSLDDIFDDMNG